MRARSLVFGPPDTCSPETDKNNQGCCFEPATSCARTRTGRALRRLAFCLLFFGGACVLGRGKRLSRVRVVGWTGGNGWSGLQSAGDGMTRSGFISLIFVSGQSVKGRAQAMAKRARRRLPPFVQGRGLGLGCFGDNGLEPQAERGHLRCRFLCPLAFLFDDSLVTAWLVPSISTLSLGDCFGRKHYSFAAFRKYLQGGQGC